MLSIANNFFVEIAFDFKDSPGDFSNLQIDSDWKVGNLY